MAKKDWFYTDEWEDSPDALASFYKRVARCRGKSHYNTRRKGSRLLQSEDPVKKAAGYQILSKLIADQEAAWDGGDLEREYLAGIYFRSKQFARAEEEYRTCHVFLKKKRKLRKDQYDYELGRVLVHNADSAKRDEGEGYLRDFYRRTKAHEYQPYEELEARLTYDLPLCQVRGMELIDCNMIEMRYQDHDHVIGGLSGAIDGLDAALFKEPMVKSLKPEFVRETMLPELGAFVGNWVVQFKEAKWEKQTPLVKSRLRVKDALHDPFLWAFKAIYYFYPLNRILEESL
jgi:hypothetical protein